MNLSEEKDLKGIPGLNRNANETNIIRKSKNEKEDCYDCDCS
jgi:hypothetical protein